MPLVLDHCTDEDVPRIVAIIFAAFGDNHPYLEASFPNKKTPSGLATAIARFLSMKNSDPTNRFLKVTDTTTGEILGVAKWNVYDDPANKPKEGSLEGDFWETEDEKAYASHLFVQFHAARWKHIRETTRPLLDILATDPKHQYRGIGGMLVGWGTELADKTNAECTVEASLEGRHLYEKCGFIMHQHITLEASGKWADRPKERIFWMVRPAFSE